MDSIQNAPESHRKLVKNKLEADLDTEVGNGHRTDYESKRDQQ